jgi:type VI secretion system secreted protein Hcp
MSPILKSSILAACLALPASATAAAVDYFLKLDGVPGESTSDGHKGEIAIESWSWGASQAASGNRTKPCVASINFTKNVDKASPVLMANTVSGMVIPNGILIGRKAGERQQDYLRIELKTVIVSSYQAGGGSSGTPMDSFSLNFANAMFEYKEQAPDGSVGQPTKASFQGGC